jgi:hypothetical protein
VQSTLSHASYKLTQLRERDPKAYAYFMEDEAYRGVAEYVQSMYLEGEQLR